MNREQAKEIIKRDISCTDYLEKSKSGLYCCPICGSGHGSHGTGAVKYYPVGNTWYCHACNRGGDVIDAYQAIAGTDYNTALSFLAARAGITINEGTDPGQNSKQKKDSKAQRDFTGENDNSHDKTEKAAQIENFERKTPPADYTNYYEVCRGRIKDPAAVKYLEARGISTETAAAFGIGYDPAADPAGAPGATGDEYKVHPAPRLIIPCSAAHYVARSIDPETPKEFKALNPNQQRGGGKVALFNSAAIYSGAEAIFICEGVFDALSFLEVGRAAIALNSKGNGKLLKKLLQDQPAETAFIICPDNDSDPNTAADTMKRAKELNAELRRMNYKSIIYNVAGQHHDANDELVKDPAAFEQAAAAAVKELKRDDLTDFLDKVKTEAYRPHRTGLKFFDNLLSGGIIQQSVLLLMAAPGAGKTTLAQQLAETIAENKSPVIYFNFEMSREQMLAKAISAKLYRRGGNKSALEILQGYNWTIDEQIQIEDVINEYRAKNYPYIKYNPAGISSDLNDLLSYLRATGDAAKAAGKPAPAAIIDYLHLLTSSEKIDTAELIKQSIVGLKRYAVDYNTFVIAISATNRDSSKSGRITLESGRDSSNIEFTGDYVLSLQYDAIDGAKDSPSKKIRPADVEALAELQQQTKRLMILRVLKSRLIQPGKYERIMLDGAHNMFYGTCDDFIPPEGFILDDGAPAFEDDTQPKYRHRY